MRYNMLGAPQAKFLVVGTLKITLLLSFLAARAYARTSQKAFHVHSSVKKALLCPQLREEGFSRPQLCEEMAFRVHSSVKKRLLCPRGTNPAPPPAN